jgi:hypothetical protein
MRRHGIAWMSAAAVCLGALSDVRAQDPRGAKALFEQQVQAKQDRDRKARHSLLTGEPWIFAVPRSLKLDGDGLGGITRLAHLDPGSTQGLLLPGGTLYFVGVKDFNRNVLRLHWDPDYGFKEHVGERLAVLTAGLPGVPADSEFVLRDMDRLRRGQTPAELRADEYIDQLKQLGAVLNVEQIRTVREVCARQEKQGTALAALVAAKARDRSPDAAHKAWQLYEEIRTGQAYLDRRDVLGKDQADALHAFMNDLWRNADFKAEVGGSVSVYAGGRTLEETMALSRRQTEDAVRRLQSRGIAFELAGPDAPRRPKKDPTGMLRDGDPLLGPWVRSVYTPSGELLMQVEPLDGGAEGARVRIGYDPDATWERVRKGWLTDFANLDDPSGRLLFLKKAPDWHSYLWGWPLEIHRQRAGTAPVEAEARLRRMLDDMSRAAADAVAAYRKLAEAPSDASRQRGAFEAFREALKVETRNGILAGRRERYAEAPELDALPWLLDAGLADSWVRAEPGRAHVYLTEPEGTFKLDTDPRDGRQHVIINIQGGTLGGWAPEIQKQLRTCFGNRSVTLNVQPGAAARRFSGIVEGDSVEAVLRSLALRTGTRLSRDAGGSQAWTLSL